MANLVQSLTVVVDAAGFSSSDKSKLMALVQAKQGDEENELGAPAAATYKSQSGGIVDVLEDLKEKAQGEPNNRQLPNNKYSTSTSRSEKCVDSNRFQCKIDFY